MRDLKNKIKSRTNHHLVKTKSWFKKNEKYLIIGFFTFGLIVDNLTLTRIDQVFDNLVILSYLFLAVISIILINYFKAKENQGKYSYFSKFEKYLPLATQFAFGGLFSAYIIFYTKSASWATSWFFLLIIFGLFIGNEKFRKKYKEIDFQINILFLALFSFMIFFVPVILKQIGVWIFILSGVLSLLLIYGLIKFISSFVLEISQKRKKEIFTHIMGVFLLFNLMYFLNIIPPVPLSMKEIGVYRNIEKSANGDYLLEEVEVPWYSFGNYFIKISQGPVYIYASVFAPTDLETEIIYEWFRYDEQKNRWLSYDEVKYSIKGGRGDGYRGYVYSANLEIGEWRVDVKTKSSLVIGRIKFEIKDTI
ncbi:MAG: DUF2914 domain-containing protein [Candidatus Pacebacteria bacterium]|nr:DUF2914 domain-containing protein [Candidatus Paceibacterota bacterium]